MGIRLLSGLLSFEKPRPELGVTIMSLFRVPFRFTPVKPDTRTAYVFACISRCLLHMKARE